MANTDLSSLYKGMGALFSQRYASRELAYEQAQKALGAAHLDLYSVLGEALSRMPESDSRTAVENALGGGSFRGRPLADRRREMAKRLDVSERTLFRKEAAGASELSLHIEEIVALQDVPSSDEKSELSALRNEVRDLKGAIERLEEVIAKQSARQRN